MVKKRQPAENTCSDWCEWLISHIAECVKKFESDTKGEIMKLFEIKIEKYDSNNTPKDNCKTKFLLPSPSSLSANLIELLLRKPTLCSIFLNYI